MPVTRMPRGLIVRLPAQIGYPRLLGFACTLFALQVLSGTDPVFAILIFLFTVIAGVAFNVAGGLTTTAGVGLTMLALKIVLISQVAKVVFWQPADSYLELPLTTAAVLVVGIASLLLGLILAGDVRRYRGVLPTFDDPRSLLIAAVVSGLIGGLCNLYVFVSGVDSGVGEIKTGGGLGIARQLMLCTPLSVIFATAHTIVRSGRTRSISPLVVAMLVAALAIALTAGTKQGVFEPILYYVLACIAWRFPLRRTHFMVLVGSLAFALFVAWPVMQTFKFVAPTASFGERVELARNALENMSSVSDFKEAKEGIEDVIASDRYLRFSYYGRYIGWLDRFSLIEQDDELILATHQQGETGWETIIHAFRSLVPSFIDPDKPKYNTAGFLGKRIDAVGDDDENTQIAFGIVAESFCAFSWLGVLVLPAVLMFAFGHTTSRLAASLESNAWTVYLIGNLQHSFVESTISSFIQRMTLGALVLLGVASLIKAVIRAVNARVPVS
jgi:hypothetical protein